MTVGNIKRESILGLIKGPLKKKLGQCQKACLLKCVSSQILKYENSLASKFGSTEYLYNSEKGICTEFTRVFDDLSSEFGLNSRVMGNIEMAHAYNKVQIDGKWVYLEPQTNVCEFFTETPEAFGKSSSGISSSDRGERKALTPTDFSKSLAAPAGQQ